jgi:hypothetical protein
MRERRPCAMLGGDKEVVMRRVREVSALMLAAFVVATVAAAGATASPSWVQPPAWVPIASPAPHAPAVVGAAHLWVQPPAWIPIAD